MMSLTANWVSIFLSLKLQTWFFSKAIILLYNNNCAQRLNPNWLINQLACSKCPNPHIKSGSVIAGWVDVPQMYYRSLTWVDLWCLDGLLQFCERYSPKPLPEHYGFGEIFKQRWLVLRPGCLGYLLHSITNVGTRLFIHGAVAGAEVASGGLCDPASVEFNRISYQVGE